jgi:Flp pilus assembly CpaE family ATPase
MVLWLTTPDYASVRDSLQALYAVRGPRVKEDRIRIILNATTPELEVRPSSIEEVLSARIFWTIPFDRLLRRSSTLGRAAVEEDPTSPAASNLIDLARVLTGGSFQPVEEQPKKGLLSGLSFGRSKSGPVEARGEASQ